MGGGFWGYFLLPGLLILPAVLFFCAVYYLAIERPCMDKNWPSKLASAVRRLVKRPKVAVTVAEERATLEC
jgi:hypothetical protein